MKRIALVFSGQGSQYAGMGKRIYDNYKEARAVYEEAEDVLGIDIKKLCFEGKPEELDLTENTQISVFTTSMAMYKAYQADIGFEPHCMAGHSLGEYAALTAAGKIKFQDALNLVKMRGKFMQAAVNETGGCMSCIVGVDADTVQSVCNQYNTKDLSVMIANYNSPKQNVISGNSKAVESACRELEGMGAKIIELQVKAPFHSILMKSAADKMEVYLKDYHFYDTAMSVISNVKARAYTDSSELYRLLPEQIVTPVRWYESMLCIENMGVNTVIELGPKAVLKKLTEYSCPCIRSYAYDLEGDGNEMKAEAASSYGISREETNWNSFIEKCIASAICTQNRNWNEQEYEEGVIKPYQMIKEKYYARKDNKEKADIEQAKQAYHMLNSVLDTKKATEKERNYILEEIFYGRYGAYADSIMK